MTREIGNAKGPLWLIGDSNPTNWADKLASPLDPRHPARHNIVTPILDGMQDALYRSCARRIETRELYIRNAVVSAGCKPNDREVSWSQGVLEQVDELREVLTGNRPTLILTFGAFSYEFARRAMRIEPA